KRRPWLVQFLTTSTIFLLGDLSAQTVSSHAFSTAPYSPARGARAWLIGAGLSIPGYTWFTWLARTFNFTGRAAWARTMGTKVLIQQCVFMPLVQTYFFSAQILLSGGSVGEARSRVLETLPTTWGNSWKVWPAVMVVTFTYVPVQYRSVVNGAVGCCWQTYLSWVNMAAEAKEGKGLGVREEEGAAAGLVRQSA
ncbi:hypothetical protein LTR53_018288, partial [Teratosphaeriaceae sp. CCFEE 6253]